MPHLVFLLFIFWIDGACAESYAYITNQGDNSVSVINTNTNKVIQTIAVGHRPAGVAVSNNGKRVYVTNPESKDISVIDTKTLKNIKTIKMGGGPLAILVSPDDQSVYY